jgi:hypothetical protein
MKTFENIYEDTMKLFENPVTQQQQSGGGKVQTGFNNSFTQQGQQQPVAAQPQQQGQQGQQQRQQIQPQQQGQQDQIKELLTMALKADPSMADQMANMDTEQIIQTLMASQQQQGA